MRITSATPHPVSRTARSWDSGRLPDLPPTDEYRLSRNIEASPFKDKNLGYATIGLISLAGAMLGSYAGGTAGVGAGLAGALVGFSAGATIGHLIPNQQIEAGAILGAVTGGVIGACLNSPTASLAMGAAGLTLPIGSIVGLVSFGD